MNKILLIEDNAEIQEGYAYADWQKTKKIFSNNT